MTTTYLGATRRDGHTMAAEEATKPQYLGAGLGISRGAGAGLIVGLVGWGAEGIAFGLLVGAGIGLVVGASYDLVVRRREGSQDEKQAPE